jgi:hypothetical protein
LKAARQWISEKGLLRRPLPARGANRYDTRTGTFDRVGVGSLGKFEINLVVARLCCPWVSPANRFQPVLLPASHKGK